MSMIENPLINVVAHCPDCDQDFHIQHHGFSEEVDSAIEIFISMHKQMTCPGRT